MSKRWMSFGLLLVLGVVAALWLTTPATNAAMPAPDDPAAGITCGTKHCSPGAICCRSCTTGEPICRNSTHCPECAPR